MKKKIFSLILALFLTLSSLTAGQTMLMASEDATEPVDALQTNPDASQKDDSLQNETNNTREVVTLAGDYYINSLFTRTFLTYTPNDKNILSFQTLGRPVPDLQAESLWKLMPAENGYHYIQREWVSNTIYRVCYDESQTRKLNFTATTDITNRDTSLWRFEAGDNGYRIVNKYSGTMLRVYENVMGTLVCGNPLQNNEEESDMWYWRLVEKDAYNRNSVTAFTVTAQNFVMRVGNSASFRASFSTETTPSNASPLLCEMKDFVFDTPTDFYFDWATVNGKIFSLKGLECFSQTVSFRHLPSGISCDMTISVVPKPGEYILRNAKYPLYCIENGTLLRGSNRTQSASATFTLESDSATSEYFYIRTASGKYLTVSSSGTDVILSNKGDSDPKQQWKFQVHYTNGSKTQFSIRPKSNSSLSIKMNETLNLTVPGDPSLAVYTADSSDDDEWFFMKKDSFSWLYPGNWETSNGNFYGLEIEEMEALSKYTNKRLMNNSYGFYSNNYRYLDSDLALTALLESQMITFIGHGTNTHLVVTDFLSGQTAAHVKLEDIQNDAIIPDNGLADVELILFVTCRAGEGGATANNLVKGVTDKGAQTVVGFNRNIGVEESIVWLEAFYDSYVIGSTVTQAMLDADEVVRNTFFGKQNITTSLQYRVVTGNPNQTIFS